MNFDEHIVQVLYNEYGGSEQKATVILSDAKQYFGRGWHQGNYECLLCNKR